MQASIPMVIGIVFMAFIISIPCGYFRQNYVKYSFMWFLLIHIPIPLIVLMRIGAGIDWRFIPLTLGGSVAGQIVGGAVNRRRKQ
jgi:hypothetical protein